MQAVSFGYGQGYVGLVYLFKTCLVAELRSAYKALDGCIRGSPIPWQVAYAGKSRLSLSRLLWGQTFSKAVAMPWSFMRLINPIVNALRSFSTAIKAVRLFFFIIVLI